MCAKKEPRDVLQPVADLDAEFPVMIRGLVLDLDRNYRPSRLNPGERAPRTSAAWVGALAYYGLLENV